MTNQEPKNLVITEAKFNELYPDMVGDYNFFNEPPPVGISKQEFEHTYLRSKLWRLNNLYWIVDKDGNPTKFKMRLAQHVAYAATRIHPRVVILKSRQQGISTLWLVSYFDDTIFCPFLNLGLMAQGTDEAAFLLERAKFLWDTLDPSIKNFLNIKLLKDNLKEFSFSNKSTMFIRVSFRSTTLQRLHVSEFGKIANKYPQRAKEVKTGTLQALGKGNTGVIESTAEGRNMFKEVWDAAVLAYHSGQLTTKDFYPVFLSWLDDPDCRLDVEQAVTPEAAKYFAELETDLDIKLTARQKNFWVAQYRELGGDIHQEYPATPEEAFTASRDGTYYAHKYNELVVRRKRVKHDLYDPNLPVEVIFDLGVDDYTVMGFVQHHRGEVRIIDEYFNDGYDLEWYIDYIYDETKYRPACLRFPHDISVRQMVSGRATGGRAITRKKMIEDYLKDKNIRVRVVAMSKPSIADGIESTRKLIPNLWMDTKCGYLQDCMLNYSKEWDEKLQQWKQTPLHDEFSHGADVIRSISQITSWESTSTPSSSQRRRISGYDI